MIFVFLLFVFLLLFSLILLDRVGFGWSATLLLYFPLSPLLPSLPLIPRLVEFLVSLQPIVPVSFPDHLFLHLSPHPPLCHITLFHSHLQATTMALPSFTNTVGVLHSISPGSTREKDSTLRYVVALVFSSCMTRLDWSRFTDDLLLHSHSSLDTNTTSLLKSVSKRE